MPTHKKIIIVMPAYNAGRTIGSVLERIPLSLVKRIFQIIIVNDGSTDDTGAVIEELKEKYKKIKILTHPKNRGYGAAQKTGFKEAVKEGADIGVLLHSDGQYAPEIMHTLLDPFEYGYDVVQGSRMLAGGALKGGMPLYKYFGNKFLTLLENFAYGLNMAEYHSGYMLYSKKALITIPFEKLSNTFHFDGEMLLMAAKKKLRVKEIPIPTRYSTEKSHLNPFTYGIDVLKIIYRNWRGKYDF